MPCRPALFAASNSDSALSPSRTGFGTLAWVAM